MGPFFLRNINSRRRHEVGEHCKASDRFAIASISLRAPGDVALPAALLIRKALLPADTPRRTRSSCSSVKGVRAVLPGDPCRVCKVAQEALMAVT